MKRIATLFVAGALVLAASSTASAQVNLSFGRGGTVLSFGQPAYNYGYGGLGYAQPGFYGSRYGAYTAPYTTGYGVYASPYTTGTTTYSSAYRGYVAPLNSVIGQQTYTTSPYGYGYSSRYSTGYSYGAPYGGYANPYGVYRGYPLIRGSNFGINLVPN